MLRQNLRLRVDSDGNLEIVDPGLDELSLMRTLNPSWELRRSEIPGFSAPKFQKLRRIGCSLPISSLAEEPEEKLWEIHAEIIERAKRDKWKSPKNAGAASILDLKIELARRILTECRLCGHRCGVDRTRGERGICLLGMEGVVAEHFVHIAEESVINPSLVLSLGGCGLRCRFCQQAWLLDPSLIDSEEFDPSLWASLQLKGARSLSFVGGNPDESLYSILRFLAGAPPDWKLPIVWNCHGFGTKETLKILEGVVDVYLPDFKFGCGKCAEQLSMVQNYPAVAKEAVSLMLGQNVPVIVRILVLPGHFDCCHKPVLEFLSTLNREKLLISVRGQYCPDWQVTPEYGELARRPTREEIEDVVTQARELGLILAE